MSSDIALKIDRLTIGDWSTLKFFGVNVLTINIILYVWIWQIANKLGTAEEQASNRLIAILIFIAVAWAPYVSEILDQMNMRSFSATAFSMVALASVAVALAQYVIAIILSVKMRPLFENFCRKQGKTLKLETWLCFVFPFYYQYFKLYQLYTTKEYITKNDLFDDLSVKLQKLELLKKQGTISQEQYDVFKERILKKMYGND